jgi:hypothetical protein
VQYKFDLGGSRTNVEEAAACGNGGDRSFYFNGSGSSYTAADAAGNRAELTAADP